MKDDEEARADDETEPVEEAPTRKRPVFDEDDTEKRRLEKQLKDAEEEAEAEEEALLAQSGKAKPSKNSKMAKLKAEFRREKGLAKKEVVKRGPRNEGFPDDYVWPDADDSNVTEEDLFGPVSCPASPGSPSLQWG